ncbi:DUF4190 domain-containing protein [Serinibacter salmoneus]|uniref:DUF4190 domain-containing protein n=1 Tax=Serinibacter salmoneus TaxID=556530 RepID=A0A2A9CX39_9MICO|nr:DUF4190 domain-containing protein [Serinibacter salmoneus]PFG18994.1 hypothetical protein ATL40_0548 [Serinibacter salmoneus]
MSDPNHPGHGPGRNPNDPPPYPSTSGTPWGTTANGDSASSSPGEGGQPPYSSPYPGTSPTGAQAAGSGGGYPWGAPAGAGESPYAAAGQGYPPGGQPEQQYAVPQYPGQQYPGQQYAAPQYMGPQYTGPQREWDGVSVAAFVTALLGLMIVPLVLGILGLGRTRDGVRQGRWMAVVGLVLGIVQTLFTAVIVVLVAIGFFTALEDSRTGSSLLEDPSSSLFGDAHYYGDDPELDLLWDSCEEGDMLACDSLFEQSPSGSEYEEFADTCGGLTDGGIWCEEAFAGNA